MAVPSWVAFGTGKCVCECLGGSKLDHLKFGRLRVNALDGQGQASPTSLRFGLEAGLLADAMRQPSEYRRHFRKRLAGSQGGHGAGKAIDALNYAVVEY